MQQVCITGTKSCVPKDSFAEKVERSQQSSVSPFRVNRSLARMEKKS